MRGLGRSYAAAAAAAWLAGCAAEPRPATQPAQQSAAPQGAAQTTSMTAEQLTAAVAAAVKRSDTQADARVREQIAADANRDAQACVRLAPQSAACWYDQALALGLDAKAHPLHANETLKSMLAALAAAAAADPTYDDGGPARVKALVLVRAPGWPLGPGDPDAGLEAAKQAVTLRGQYPPNVLALAEALAKTGDARMARESYARARDLSLALPPGAERDAWLRDADQALAAK